MYFLHPNVLHCLFYCCMEINLINYSAHLDENSATHIIINL